MLRLNVTQEKQLTFEVQIGGVHHDQISSQFKIIIDEIEYGFPAKVGSETITVNLPPINKIVGTKIVEGDEAEVRLEIVADGHFLTPWQDRATLSNPLIVEAKIKDTSFVPNPTFETKLVVEEDGAKQTSIIEKKEEMTSDQKIEALSSKLETLIEMQEKGKDEGEEEVEEKCDATNEQLSAKQKEALKKGRNSEKAKDFKKKLMKEEDEEKEETVEEDIKDKSQALEKLLNKTIDTFELSEDSKKKNEMTLEEFKRNLTKEDVMRYIASKGSKKPEVQELVYEQAKINAKKDTPAYILKEVVKILKK